MVEASSCDTSNWVLEYRELSGNHVLQNLFCCERLICETTGSPPDATKSPDDDLNVAEVEIKEHSLPQLWKGAGPIHNVLSFTLQMGTLWKNMKSTGN